MNSRVKKIGRLILIEMFCIYVQDFQTVDSLFLIKTLINKRKIPQIESLNRAGWNWII